MVLEEREEEEEDGQVEEGGGGGIRGWVSNISTETFLPSVCQIGKETTMHTHNPIAHACMHFIEIGSNAYTTIHWCMHWIPFHSYFSMAD